jgi:chromosome partitioning protein
VKTIAFFNNKGGVGKTSLAYHLAWMFAEFGESVLAADLDPQSNLTSMFLDDEGVEDLWSKGGSSIYESVRPLLEGTGDVAEPHVCDVESGRLGLLAGDLALSQSEDELNAQWSRCLDKNVRAFRVESAFWRVVRMAAERRRAGIVLIDVGPNLGAVNRAALLAAQYVVVPLAADVYSLRGLMNLGPTLRRWREEWSERRRKSPDDSISLPEAAMQPAGYVVMQHALRLDRPTKAYDRWMGRIPDAYRKYLLDDDAPTRNLRVENDPMCLGALKHYRSLMPLAQEARKPMFLLTAADGAIGGHAKAVQQCYADFAALAQRIDAAAAVGA